MSDLEENQFGMEVWDTEKSYIKRYPAEKSFEGEPSYYDNWVPIAGTKQILCGTLTGWNVFDGTANEVDWNLYINPSTKFDFIYSEVLPYRSGDGQWYTCGENHHCLEGEITPQQLFRSNMFFPRSTCVVEREEYGTTSYKCASPLVGRQICVYGPWVRERIHNQRPEIHPSELLFWKDKTESLERFGVTVRQDAFWWMQMQDRSGRFDSEDDFDSGGEGDEVMWAGAPLRHAGRIAFVVNPAVEYVTFGISQVNARRVEATGTEYNADVRRHAISIDGKAVASVTESSDGDAYVRVEWEGVCRDTQSNVRGYLRVSSGIAAGGYHLFRIVRSKAAPRLKIVAAGEQGLGFVPAAVQQETGGEMPQRPASRGGSSIARPYVRLDPVSGTLRKQGSGIVGDATLSRSVARMFAGTGAKRRQLPLAKVAGIWRVTAVPVLPAEPLSAIDASGNAVPVSMYGLGLFALVDVVPGDTDSGSVSWNRLASLVGGKQTPNADSLLSTSSFSEVRIRVVPRYGVVRDGEVFPEDESPWAEQLNRAVARPSVNHGVSLAPKISATWDVKAFDQEKAEAAPVVLGGAGGVSVNVTDVRQGTSVATVRFGDARKVFKLQGEIHLNDAFGNTLSIPIEAWSVGIRVAPGTTDVLLRALGELGAKSPEAVVAMSKSKDSLSPDARRAIALRNAANDVSRDGVISVSELRTLVRAVSALEGPK